MNSLNRRFVRSCALVLIFGVLVIPLSACWDEVDLQDVSYVSAIGVDYVDGKFQIYAQMINFSNVAKTDLPASGPSQQWIGRGEGESVLKAFFNLSRGSYAELNVEHLKTIIVHERAIGKLDDVLDGLNRQRASRYTSLLYGTKESIETIFTADTFFDQSPLNSLLYTPWPHEKVYTFLDFFEMRRAVQSLKEPATVTLLPVLDTNKKVWKNNEKPMNTQIVTGAFVFKEQKFQSFVPQKDIIGLRWLQSNFSRVVVDIEKTGYAATIAVTRCNQVWKVEFAEGRPKFHLKLKLHGHVIELDGSYSEQELEAGVQEVVEQDVRTAYVNGVERKMDLLGLEHRLYRYHHSYWKGQVVDRGWLPKEDELEVDIRFTLDDSGKFDLQSD